MGSHEESSRGFLGKHFTCVEEPDVIFLRLEGPVSAEEGAEINRLHREFGRGRDQVYFLVDLLRLESIHPEVRKEAGLVMKELPVRAVALYQAPLRARVIAKLILTAMNMFRSEEEKVPVRFVDTEEEGRAWIAKRRAEAAPRRVETVGAERS